MSTISSCGAGLGESCILDDDDGRLGLRVSERPRREEFGLIVDPEESNCHSICSVDAVEFGAVIESVYTGV